MVMRRWHTVGALTVVAGLVLAGCGDSEDDAFDTTEAVGADDDCAVDALPFQTDGTLTIGTDSPAFPP